VLEYFFSSKQDLRKEAKTDYININKKGKSLWLKYPEISSVACELERRYERKRKRVLKKTTTEEEDTIVACLCGKDFSFKKGERKSRICTCRRTVRLRHKKLHVNEEPLTFA
jgi:hypothetical protein|tara:strand:- start:206 stop:541 length:336 start_codon:yes stop_codon:yes gene_type:complete